MVDTTLNIADAFCGAGGSSTGLRIAMGELGLSYRLGVLNHWDVAIATHKANHPDATHIRANAIDVEIARHVYGEKRRGEWAQGFAPKRTKPIENPQHRDEE